MPSFLKKALVIASIFLITSTLPVFAQSVQFRFGTGQFRYERSDPRANVQGKRASCEVYARIAVVQSEANRQFQCGYTGPRWTSEAPPHFRWCRYAARPQLVEEFRARAQDLQSCFDRLGDFDEGR